MRQIALDTETTGLEPKEGHRVIEIGAIELINRRLTGRYFHVYINPERAIELGAEQVHGLTNDFLKDKPLFADIVDDFVNFIDKAELIIHNAPFDVGFLNHEFRLLNRGMGRIDAACSIIDTLALARQLHPGQRNSLDALCKRYGIDNAHRQWHGALIDANLLASTYLAMTSGQDSLFNEVIASENMKHKDDSSIQVRSINMSAVNLPVILANADELAEHEARLKAIEKNSGSAIWRKYE